MLKKIFILLIVVFCLISGCSIKKVSVWEDFKASKKTGKEPILPDFSYAGYKYSEKEIPKVNYKIFDVTQYGAIANDTTSDKEAIKKAISAAEKNGQGVVYFPKGIYYINTEKDDQSIIHIKSSNIVFRGEDREQTILFFEKDLPPKDPRKLWTCPSAIKVGVEGKDKVLTKIISKTKRETFKIKVEDISKIKEGDWVIITVINNDKDFIKKHLDPLPLDSAWKSIINTGVNVKEYHQVKNIKGNEITFYEPIHYNIEPKYNWKISTYEHAEHVGFENLSFHGNWIKKFVHHRSAQDDGGWKILNVSKVVDSWVKDCTFKNVNVAASFSHSAASTFMNVTVEGNIGHSCINASRSTNILIAYTHDIAGMHHSLGVDGNSNGTVIWRSTYPSHTCFESHASQPRCTLIDNVEGGFKTGRAGGAIQNLPNHGRYLVFWNFKETDEPEKDFSFVSEESEYWRVVPPIIIGFHGSGTTFKDDQVQVLESLGTRVQPKSLFEGQLKLRLGSLPEWIVEIQNKH